MCGDCPQTCLVQPWISGDADLSSGCFGHGRGLSPDTAEKDRLRTLSGSLGSDAADEQPAQRPAGEDEDADTERDRDHERRLRDADDLDP